MFVHDLYNPHDEEDYGEDEEEGVSISEYADLHVDEWDSEGGDKGYETDEGRNGGAPVNDMLEMNLLQLAAWADMFLDDHLRMLEPFAEIWFVDVRLPSRTAAGFNQRVMEGEGKGGRAEHMIYYPILKRDGWWWDERDPVPLSCLDEGDHMSLSNLPALSNVSVAQDLKQYLEQALQDGHCPAQETM